MATKPSRDTRQQILERAQNLFAQRGFYGTSIAAIVSELGISKQALLHYFPTKEKLYGEVLQRISEGFATLETHSDDDPAEQVKRYFSALCERSMTKRGETMLLMRELMDNRRRAEHAGTWYLAGFLENLIAMVKAVPGWEKASPSQALSLAYAWLGAINYFALSGPTLNGIFGSETMHMTAQHYPLQLERIIEASLAAGPTASGQSAT